MDREKRVSEVIKLYTEENKTCTEISKILNIQRRNVYRILERSDINLKPKKEGKCVICDKVITNNTKGRTRCGTCNTNIRRYRIKAFAVNYKGGKCEHCDWSGNIAGFDFHHVSGKDFDINAANMAAMKWEVVKLEIDKCKLLCAICHRLEHTEYTNEKLVKEAENYEGKFFA